MENNTVNPVENTEAVETAEVEPVSEAVEVEAAVEEAAGETAEIRAAAADAAAPAKSKKKALLWIIPVALVLLAALAAGGLFFAAGSSADQQFANGDYAKARSFYESMDFLPGYSEKVLECDYRIASNHFRDHRYDEARDRFLALGDYSNSADLANECLYLTADRLVKEEDYTAASEIYSQLGDYKDSAELASECVYLHAKDLAADKDFQSAIDTYSGLGDYKDSTTLKVQCEIDMAADHYRNGRFEECMAIAEKLEGQHEHAELYYTLGLLGTLRETGTDLDTLRTLADYVNEYRYKVSDATKALEHPQFHILRFIDGAWESTDGNYLVLASEDQALYYDVSWYTPDGNPWYASDDERLYFFTDAADEFWFSIEKFSDPSALSAPWTMYVMDNEDHVHIFFNEDYVPQG